MKKKLLLSAFVLSAAGAMAQLPPDSYAPDFTATDIDGNTQHLYDYLDQGYTVFLDISAAWCAPCWAYHNSGALEGLYNTYGPGTADNKVMVLFIEGESTNTTAQLYGPAAQTGSYATTTQGDWVTGTPYPIIDNAAIANAYEITYFPTIYMVCPNRIVNEVGQKTTAQLWAGVSSCASATSGLNASLLQYTGDKVICSDVNATITLQNMGTSTLTTVDVAMMEGATVLNTQTWTGSLDTYNTADVTFPATTVTDPSAVTFAITTADGNSADNTLNPGLSSAVPAMANLTFTLNLDYYCAETTWKLYNSAGAIVHSGGPYSCSANGGGTDAHTTKTYSWTVPEDCYRMYVYDAYGDGLTSAAYGHAPDGDFHMVDGGGHLVYSGAGNFGTQYLGGLNVNMPAGIEQENALSNSLNVYPNPTDGILNLNYNLDHAARVTIEVYNALGKLVMAHSNTVPAGLQLQPMDISSLDNGIYFMNITADGLKASRTITLNK